MTRKREFHSGQQVGHLTILEHAAGYGAQVKCRCRCGSDFTTRLSNLARGDTRSCGCLHKQQLAERNQSQATHHQSGAYRKRAPSPTYTSWVSMRQRCRNPNHQAYANYGGRGITVCARWDSFEQFLADMGERPQATTLDRIHVNGNYEPSNCRWATLSEQRRNRRDSNQ